MNRICTLLVVLFFIESCTLQENISSETEQGSYATMLAIGTYLYVVDKTHITTFDVAIPSAPEKIDKQSVGFDIESIFNYEGVLLIGSSTAMHIFELDKGIPKRKEQVPYFSNSEVTSCDPIVASNGYAYVTLSTSIEGPCSRNIQINELRIYDVKEIGKPLLLNTQQLRRPKGLGIDNSILFVCDAQEGLLIYNVEDKKNIKLIKKFDGFSGYDVIAKNGKLLVSSTKKLLQYDYSDPNNIRFIGTINL